MTLLRAYSSQLSRLPEGQLIKIPYHVNPWRLMEHRHGLINLQISWFKKKKMRNILLKGVVPVKFNKTL